MLDFDKLPRFKPQCVRILELIPQWAMAFSVDEKAIMRQLPIAHAWVVSNPGKGPKSQITRFLFHWMAKAKQFGNLAPTRETGIFKEKLAASEELLTYEDIQAMKK